MELSEYYVEQERQRVNSIRRGDLILSDEPDDSRGLRLSSDKAEIAAIKSIASGLTKTVTDSLKAIGKAKDASSIKSSVEEAQASIAKQLKRLSAYAANLEGEGDELGDDAEVEETPPPKKRVAKKDVAPRGKTAKAVAASHQSRRSLRLAAYKDLKGTDKDLREMMVTDLAKSAAKKAGISVSSALAALNKAISDAESNGGDRSVLSKLSKAQKALEAAASALKL